MGDACYEAADVFGAGERGHGLAVGVLAGDLCLVGAFPCFEGGIVGLGVGLAAPDYCRVGGWIEGWGFGRWCDGS